MHPPVTRAIEVSHTTCKEKFRWETLSFSILTAAAYLLFFLFLTILRVHTLKYVCPWAKNKNLKGLPRATHCLGPRPKLVDSSVTARFELSPKPLGVFGSTAVPVRGNTSENRGEHDKQNCSHTHRGTHTFLVASSTLEKGALYPTQKQKSFREKPRGPRIETKKYIYTKTHTVRFTITLRSTS